MSENRPLLADKITSEEGLAKLRYPLFVSPKLDGLRLRIDPALGGISRTAKPLPNHHLQDIILRNLSWMRFLDGEAICGDPTAPDVFNKTQSAFMSHGGNPDLHYYIFDHWFLPTTAYDLRYLHAKEIVQQNQAAFSETGGSLNLVPQEVAHNKQEVLDLESKYLALGYEGIMLRDPHGKYKFGRSTVKEQILVKFKRVADDEAIVVGFEALERNDNPLTRDAFGLAKRSAHTAGKRVDNLLGNLIVEHPTFGQFSIGSGFDFDTREEVWLHQDRYHGKTVTFKYQPVGTIDKPRFPIFKGFRHD